MKTIMASVGAGGVNRKTDVAVVQRLPNQHKIPGNLLPLKMDMRVGPKTIDRIIGFQKHILKMARPDGRVDPYGRTIRALGGTTSAVGSSSKGKNLYKLPFPYTIDHIPKSTPKNRRPGLSLKPVYLTIHSTANPKSSAKNERGWLTNNSNSITASFHIVVDEKEAIEAIPLNEVA